MTPENKALFERALTDFVLAPRSKLCMVDARRLRKWMQAHPHDYPDLPDDQALGSQLRDFFFLRATIYDAEKIKAGVSTVSALRPIWVDNKMNVVGMSND